MRATPVPPCGALGRQESLGEAFAIMLDACRPQSGDADPIEQTLPVCQFFRRHPVPRASFVDGQQTSFDRRNNLRLAPTDPPRRVGRRQIVQCQFLTQRTNHRRWTYLLVLDHFKISVAGLAPHGAPPARATGEPSRIRVNGDPANMVTSDAAREMGCTDRPGLVGRNLGRGCRSPSALDARKPG